MHVGLGTTGTRPYPNNGRPAPSDWLGGGENMRSRDFPAIAHAAENFLTSMILDGVFERHARLRGGVIELGGSWVPGFLRLLDHAAVAFRRTARGARDPGNVARLAKGRRWCPHLPRATRLALRAYSQRRPRAE